MSDHLTIHGYLMSVRPGFDPITEANVIERDGAIEIVTWAEGVMGPRPIPADLTDRATAWAKQRAATEYRRLRAAAYPPLADLADALVKIGSGDPALIAEGEAQRAAYVAACLAVKAAHPKPEP